MRNKLVSAAYWCTPTALAFVLYWPGLLSWFQKDDFAWLGLYRMIHSWPGLWNVLFHPYAQGTIRPLSERAYFTVFYALFGMNALPYHILAFLTFSAALVLCTAVCAKLTHSRAAGFWAAILWAVNAEMAFALSWVALYHELLCALLFLLGLWLLLRYADTRNPQWLAAQWAVFLTGFLVQEQNVVYPALALVCTPRLFRQILPMFGASAIYAFLHFQAAQLPPEGVYRMHWDLHIFSTLWTYWKWALGPSRLIMLGIYPSKWRSALTAAFTIALLCFLIGQLRRRNWTILFFPAWFLIVLAPLLPLRDHMEDYYLTIPLIGLAMWAAWALESHRWIAPIFLIAYLAVAIPLGHRNLMSFYDRSQRIHHIIETVVQLHQPVILTHVDADLFWSAIYHRPFRLYGLNDVYVSPADRPAIDNPPHPDLDSFFRPPAPGELLFDVR